MSAARCLLCGEARLDRRLAGVFDTRFGIAGRYDIARCAGCGLEQTLPRPDQGLLERLYAEHYNTGAAPESAWARLRARLFASPAYQLFLRLDGDVSFHTLRGPGRLLDVGCNEGRGLAVLAARGFEVEGLEVNPRAAATARAKGFTVHEAPLEAFRPERPYDVVVLSNVLEHLLEPRDALVRLRALLAPEGRLCISCPNAASWQRRLFGRAWINWHVPFHIVHFDESRLVRLLEECGYTVTRRRQVSPALWLAQSLVAAAAARPGRAPRALRSVSTMLPLMAAARGLLFPLLVAADAAGRGDCLRVVAVPAPQAG